MTFLWLIVWLIDDTPDVRPWGIWLIALLVCIVIDVLEILDNLEKGNNDNHF